ncbi:MAG: hypothetical protein ACMUEM_01225 [Flavobacteriales bacterium AspAUS03]
MANHIGKNTLTFDIVWEATTSDSLHVRILFDCILDLVCAQAVSRDVDHIVYTVEDAVVAFLVSFDVVS